MKKLLHILLCVCAVCLFYACNVTRKLPAGEYLLTKNTVTIERNDSVPKNDRVSRADLAQYIKQRPNKRILGFDFYLWLYNQSDTAKNNWGNRWLRRIGEEPVLLDSSLTDRSVQDMNLYLQSVGSFRSSVEDSITIRNKRADVNYIVRQSIPYTISRIDYNFQDKFIEPIILSDTVNSLIRPGQTYNRVTLENERQRIVSQLKNIGFYRFSVNNITYTADTTAGNREINLTVNIRQQEQGLDENGNLVTENNWIYRIKEIYINTSYNPRESIDTTRTIRYDTLEHNGIKFIYRRRMNIRPEVVTRAIGLFPNYTYNESEVKYTHSSIVNLRMFQSVSILFSDMPSDEDNLVTYVGQGESGDTILTTRMGNLACNIICTPMLPQSYKIEGELSTNDNYTSISTTLGYSNRNLFRGAEIFDVSLRGAYQFMSSKGKSDSYEIGVATSLTVPRLLIPFRLNPEKRLYNVSTKTEISFSTQRRPDYRRTLSGLAFGYTWSNQGFSSFTYKPVDVNLLKVPWVNEDFLEKIENEYLRRSYISQLIAGTSASYLYSTLGLPQTLTTSLRINAETNGNLIYGLSKAFGASQKEDSTGHYYQIFGIRYAQYARADVNWSMRLALGDNNALVYRFFAGIGQGYGNSRNSTIPFERLFFAGGGNSMRGWQVRTLGPGNTPRDTSNTTFFAYQTGDIRLETNLEARFRVAGLVYGAVFADVGNVWYLATSETNADTRFRFTKFYKQLGFNTGLGLRLDFGFFLARLDWGIRLHDPGRDPGNRWIRKFRFSNTALHFAIGHPF